MIESGGIDKPKPKAGWYSDPMKSGQQRRWDGATWLDEWREPPVVVAFSARPEGWMLNGILWAFAWGIIAALILALTGKDIDTDLGFWLIWSGSLVTGTVFTIGVFAKAVEVGIRASKRTR